MYVRDTSVCVCVSVQCAGIAIMCVQTVLLLDMNLTDMPCEKGEDLLKKCYSKFFLVCLGCWRSGKCVGYRVSKNSEYLLGSRDSKWFV